MVSIFDPTDEQASVIETSQSVLVNAGPGTGKTRTAIEKALRHVNSFDDGSTAKVLFLSFSNAAVHRLSECAGVRFSIRDRRLLRFFTYHSCAADILRCYGRFVGLPHPIKIMDTLEQKIAWLERGWEFSGESNLERLTTLARDEGLVGFDVIIPFATRLLKYSVELSSLYSRRYPLIVVDEFQDTSQEQWEFLRTLGNQSQVVAFGDPNQIIYQSLHQATRDRLDEFKAWKEIEDSDFSIDNFRCKRPEILEFARSLLDGTKYTIRDEEQVALFNLRARNELRSAIALIWREKMKEASAEQTIGILAPSNGIAEQVAIELRNPPVGAKVGYKVFARIPRDEAAFDAILLAIAALRDYAKWQTDEFCRKAVFAIFAMELAWNPRRKKAPSFSKMQLRLEAAMSGDSSLLASLLPLLITSDGICKLIPDFLVAINETNDFKTAYKRIMAHDKHRLVLPEKIDPQLALFDELRNTRHPKGIDGYDAHAGRTQILNYHKAKGREFDYVIMIVDPRGESKKVSLEEKSRLYYVCATRAKEWLGIIYYGGDFGPVLGRAIAATK